MRYSKPAGNGETTFISRNNTNLVCHRTLNILDSISVNAFSYECINSPHILDLFQSLHVFCFSTYNFLVTKTKPPIIFSSRAFELLSKLLSGHESSSNHFTSKSQELYFNIECVTQMTFYFREVAFFKFFLKSSTWESITTKENTNLKSQASIY